MEVGLIVSLPVKVVMIDYKRKHILKVDRLVRFSDISAATFYDAYVTRELRHSSLAVLYQSSEQIRECRLVTVFKRNFSSPNSLMFSYVRALILKWATYSDAIDIETANDIKESRAPKV